RRVGPVRLGYGFRQRAAASGLRCWTGQVPCRYTCALRFPRPDLSEVAIERSTEYFALSIGCSARRAFLTALGVTARFNARPGCPARRTLRGIRSRVKKPTRTPPDDTRSCESYDRLATWPTSRGAASRPGLAGRAGLSRLRRRWTHSDPSTNI